MDYQALLEEIHAEVRPQIGLGRVADYIPRLAGVPADRFGMAIAAVDGAHYRVGEAAEPFSIQSIAKVFALTLTIRQAGEAALWRRIPRQPRRAALVGRATDQCEGGEAHQLVAADLRDL